MFTKNKTIQGVITLETLIIFVGIFIVLYLLLLIRFYENFKRRFGLFSYRIENSRQLDQFT